MTTAPSGVVNTATGASPPPSSSSVMPNMMHVAGLGPNAAQFREIHKNTWLKRLTPEGRKVTVGPKKSDRSWVVFCVHDDTDAMLEGYIEPRQAPCHTPEWVVSLHNTLHISHALIPNSHEFEFVVTLSNEVVRFHATSWEIMQEWVETLRSKLREMKILSPRENIYTKLPEIRMPLLPTRDPTSPLPAPPPVPAALVPGVERVIPPPPVSTIAPVTTTTATAAAAVIADTSVWNSSEMHNSLPVPVAGLATCDAVPTARSNLLSAMSNMLTQNLLNMLSDPISTYSEQLNDEATTTTSESPSLSINTMTNDENDTNDNSEFESLLRCNDMDNIHSNSGDKSVRVGVNFNQRVSADQLFDLNNLQLQTERLIPRPQTSRSLSAGAAEKTRRSVEATPSKVTTTTNSNTKTTSVVSGSVLTEQIIYNDELLNEEETRSTTLNDETNESLSNITIIQVSTSKTTGDGGVMVPIESVVTPVSAPPRPPPSTKKQQRNQLASAEVFKFPENQTTKVLKSPLKPNDYKSNVQIIPSKHNNHRNNSNNNKTSNTIQVLSDDNHCPVASGTSNVSPVTSSSYGSPLKITKSSCIATAVESINIPANANDAIAKSTTRVHLTGSNDNTNNVNVNENNTTTTSIYGTCYGRDTSNQKAVSSSTPKLTKKVILTANTSGITNIAVNNESGTAQSVVSVVKDADIDDPLSSTTRTTDDLESSGAIRGNVHYEKIFLSSSIPVQSAGLSVVLTVSNNATAKSKETTQEATGTKNVKEQTNPTAAATTQRTKSPTTIAIASTTTASISQPAKTHRIASPPASTTTTTTTTIIPQHSGIERAISPVTRTSPPILTRGLTEAVITMRPSRKDYHFLKKRGGGGTSSSNSMQHGKCTSASNNNGHQTAAGSSNNCATERPHHVALNRTHSEANEQRRRSSSTSDALTPSRTGRTACLNNNDQLTGMRGLGRSTGGNFRIQQPPQPFRSVENGATPMVGGVGMCPSSSPSGIGMGCVGGAASAGKRITVREQQVLQLRREIMHPGGVRLQLRRKDCISSIAWVDAFGAVWVAGWKQREHPVLYNALHIGDQLLSIAGIAMTSATEANKTIRNTNTLFVEVLVRRLPFGRGYAIRRDREGQCLGLIRDGNTATIVDVVPNSLAARHGLPPKAKSCDGTTLTFWILTEINGRPLNLFFKDNEIRDRLNAVGRDISILVQPADLVTKLKKQLKSLRSYKDYLVQ